MLLLKKQVSFTVMRNLKAETECLLLEFKKKHFLQGLREKKGISQRSFARAAGIPRSHIQRIETKPWPSLTLHELQMIAQSLGMKLADLIGEGQTYFKGEPLLERASLEAPFFETRLSSGTKLGSLLKNPQKCFVGTLVLAPQQGIHREQAPGGDFLFWYIVQGTLLLSLGSESCVFKEKECFSLTGHEAPYEFFNPHQFQKMTALIVTLPSFFRIGA